MSERLIKVTGKAEASTPADRVVLRFDINGWSKTYAPAVEMLNQRVETLRAGLAPLSVGRQQLKTSAFRVAPTYETTSRLGTQRRELSGYFASHTIRLELPVDQARLNEVLGAISQGESEPTLYISFEVEDASALRQEALRNAVAEAERNARTLGEAAGVSLKMLRAIEYGWSEVRLTTQSFPLERPAGGAQMAAPDLEPEDVKASESVTMTWEIEG